MKWIVPVFVIAFWSLVTVVSIEGKLHLLWCFLSWVGGMAFEGLCRLREESQERSPPVVPPKP